MSIVKRKMLQGFAKGLRFFERHVMLEKKGDNWHIDSNGRVHKNPDAFLEDPLWIMRLRGKRRIAHNAQSSLPSVFVQKTSDPSTVKLNSFTLVPGQKYAQQKPIALKLIKKVIRKLRAKGIKKIITVPTIIPPRIAAQFGFTLVKKTTLKRKGHKPFNAYEYEMKLGD